MDRLKGKTAWISGAASGIGEAIATLFAREGAQVVLADRAEKALEQVAGRLAAEGWPVRPSLCDVARADSVAASIEAAVKAFGGLQIVVNNAGVVMAKPLHETSEAEWDHLMAVNVKSILFTLTAALPHLRKNATSAIVNMASISAFVGQKSVPVYTASKHAVLGLTRCMALDYAADGIRCNCVCPGITLTPMLLSHLTAEGDADRRLGERLRHVPIGRALGPEEIAQSVLFLCGDESLGITGSALTIDGGYMCAAEWDEDPLPARQGG